MLQRVSTTVVALALAANASQAAPMIGDQGATSAKQAVTGPQDAMSVDHGRFALTVIGDKGTTLVNRGTGFSPVTGTTELKPGDRILVRNGAGARITYPDGCNVPVRGVATVDPLSPCNFMAADLPARTAPRTCHQWWRRKLSHTGHWLGWPCWAAASQRLSCSRATTTTTTASSFPPPHA